MRQSRPEPDLKQFLVHAVGIDYRPHPLTYKEWLGQVAERLRQCAASIDNNDSSTS